LFGRDFRFGAIFPYCRHDKKLSSLPALESAPFEKALLLSHNLAAAGGASGSPIFNANGEGWACSRRATSCWNRTQGGGPGPARRRINC